MKVDTSDVRASVLVASWDGAKDLWDLFFSRFFKYWPDCPFPVHIGTGLEEYKDNRVRSIKVGEDKGYSSNLIAMLEAIDTPWVLLWMEDFVISSKVDTGRMRRLLAAAEKLEAAFVNFIAFPLEITPLFARGSFDEGISEMREGAPYRIALGAALWHRETLLKLLKPGEDAWEIERIGSTRTVGIPRRFFCVDRANVDSPPIEAVNVIEAGAWTQSGKRFLEREGMEETLSLYGGKVQSKRNHYYLLAYCSIRYIFARLVCLFGGEAGMRWLARLISRRAFVVQN